MDIMAIESFVTAPLFWILTAMALFVLGLIILASVSKIRSRSSTIKMAELDLERKKLELMAKRMMIDDLKTSARVPTDGERLKIDAISLDSSILTKKILHTMEEMDGRAKRLELGTDTAKLLKTLSEIRAQERKLFGKRMD